MTISHAGYQPMLKKTLEQTTGFISTTIVWNYLPVSTTIVWNYLPVSTTIVWNYLPVSMTIVWNCYQYPRLLYGTIYQYPRLLYGTIYQYPRLLYGTIYQTLLNSLHGLLICEISGLDCCVITIEYRTRVHYIHM